MRDLEQQLRRMQAALRHRGPDDMGLYVAADRRVGFAHTRLSILDLSPDGHQPMATPDGRFTIAFNGEIYNFRQLRTELLASGVEFRSHSDTEVILRLYERQGAECVSRLRGMFAFAIWDARERICFLARDPLGIKPLYVYINGGNAEACLAFASEVRALVASGLVPGEVNPAGLMGYLRYGSVPEPITMLVNVECLPAGSTLTWQDGKISRRAYWHFPVSSGQPPGRVPVDRAEVVSGVRTALLDSIRAHYVSDVPVGLFLSGGIDSTAIAALSRVVGQTDLRTFSIAFADKTFDEGTVARRTAGLFGTRHTEWQLDGQMAGQLLPQFLGSLDQPTVDGFNTWCVARLAHQEGMKVVMSGLGGDEFFAGYPSFRRAPVLARVRYCPGIIRRPLGALLENLSQVPQRRRLGEFLQGDDSLEAAWETLHALCTWREAALLAAWLLGPPVDEIPALIIAKERARPDEQAAETISRLEATRYMRNQLLRDSDVMSMAWGLELRVPFVDSRLANVLCRLPSRERLRYGKGLLTDAVPEIPDWIANRPKTGFQFPFDRWMAEEWHDRVAAATAGSPVKLETWYRRWLVLVFQQWHLSLQQVTRDAAAPCVA